MSSGEVDLSAFPVIRLDQISLLDDATLKSALDEVSSMMDQPDFSRQSMSKYLRKQYESMLFEYNERQAAIRVQQLLSGAIEALNQSYSPRIIGQGNNPEVKTLPPKSTESSNKAQDGFAISKKLVLRDSPSPSVAPKPSIVASTSEKLQSVSEDTRPFGAVKEPIKSSQSVPSTAATASIMLEPNSLSSKPFSADATNRTSIFPSDFNQTSTTSNIVDSTTTPRSTGGKTPRVRKSDSPAEENLPSKKSVEIVYRNFGNEFIVAATERKKRFVPKKEVTETVEEKKKRERLERRKLAMENLVKRREEQENRKQQLREQRRQDKLRKLRREKGDDSSDSESVSGGDDEVEVKADEETLQAVQASVIDDGKRNFVVRLAPGQRPKPKPTSNNASSSKKIDNKAIAAAAQERGNKPPLPKATIPRQPSSSAKSAGAVSSSSNRSTSKATKEEDRAAEVNGNVSDENGDDDGDRGGDEGGHNSSSNSEADEEEEEEEERDNKGDSYNANNAETAATTANNDDDDEGSHSDGDSDAAPAPGESTDKLEENAERSHEHENDASAATAMVGDESWSSKNLSALATIRKLKEGKLNKAMSRSRDLLEESEAQLPQQQQTHREHDHTAAWGNIPLEVDAIVQRAMSEVSRAATPHIMSARASSRSSSRGRGGAAVASARNWSFDDLLPMLLTALHVQRVVHVAEVDLLQVMGDTVMFNFGPDDLPGLRALQLVHHRPTKSTPRIDDFAAAFAVSNLSNTGQNAAREFRVSLEEYHNRIYSEENAEIFDFRSVKRREISLGLVILAITCHRILFGKVAINTTQDFNQAWLAAIQSFDNQAARAAAEGRETAYFALVQVCGNGYAICKKLEVLLETYFAPLCSPLPAIDTDIDTTTADTAVVETALPISSARKSSSFIIMSRCLSSATQDLQQEQERDEGLPSIAVPLSTRRDSRDSLLDFLHTKPAVGPSVPSATTTTSLSPPDNTGNVAHESRKDSDNQNNSDSNSNSDSGSGSGSDEELPPPSSAAVSIASQQSASALSRPSSTASMRLPHSSSSALSLPTVNVYATAASAGNSSDHQQQIAQSNANIDTNINANANNSVTEYQQDAQQRSQRPMSGRRSAAAAKFRSEYLGNKQPAAEEQPSATVTVTTTTVTTAEEERHRAQRQRLAAYAQSLQAKDVLGESTFSLLPPPSSSSSQQQQDLSRMHPSSSINTGKITFSQLEEELAAADAALAFVLQQQQQQHQSATASTSTSTTTQQQQQSRRASSMSTAAATSTASTTTTTTASKTPSSTIQQQQQQQKGAQRSSQSSQSSQTTKDELLQQKTQQQRGGRTNNNSSTNKDDNSSSNTNNKQPANNRRKRHLLPSEAMKPPENTTGTTTSEHSQQLLSADGRKPPLIDFYPQFAMIFPMAYNQSLQVRDDMSYARVILESMQVQAKVYEEWIDVMRDYSTVFCHNDNNDKDNESIDGASVGKQQPSGAMRGRPRRRERAGSTDQDDDDDDVDDDNGDVSAQDAHTNGTEDHNNQKQQKQRSASVYKGENRTLHYRVKSSRSEVFNIVCDVFQSALPQWESLPAGLGLGLSWNLLWTWSKPRINHSHLLVWQKVNHFEESRQLTRKDFLKKNLQRYTDMPHSVARDFEIMPLTFLLPHEYNAFVSAFTSIESQKLSSQQQQQQPSLSTNAASISGGGTKAGTTIGGVVNYWILKPVGLSRGRGISLIRDLGDLTYAQASVIQKYVDNPLCLQQYKFDLRIYVVVTSFKPLEAFVYREGFARVSLEAYSTQPQDMDNLFIHLTNSSIQKKHTTGPSRDNPVQIGHDSGSDAEVGGSKISLLGQHGLWKRLEEYSHGQINSQAVWQSICTLIVKSLVVADDKIPHQPNCFELFGYDVLIDADLRPWLIEVNASPSLARENALDHRVKNALIRDIVNLLDVAPYDRAALARVMRKRLNNIAKQRHVHGRNDAELEQDLQDILGDYRPRRHGEVPKQLGQFERLAPETPYYAHVMKLKKKLFKDAT